MLMMHTRNKIQQFLSTIIVPEMLLRNKSYTRDLLHSKILHPIANNKYAKYILVFYI